MLNTQKVQSENKETSPEKSSIAVPSLSLPKGGGAIKGIGEKFAANPVTGTGSMSVPIATSPARSGFGPQLSLSYDSGAGNGPFGFGWNLMLPAITRKTDKGLPQYRDAEESDVYILSGAEDLVPVLNQDNQGKWVRDEFERDGYKVKRYRPRVEGLFARIERWVNLSDPQDTFWRSISKDNITTWYGKTAESRIGDPANPDRVFTWLICESYDDKGNAIVYEYAAENDDNVDRAQANERNRVRTANRYLKRIKYGNRTPNRDASTWQATDPAQLPNETWMFEVVFDYGEGYYAEDAPDAQGRIFARAQIDPPAGSHWPVRQDRFSTYRVGFEVRTYRLCRRVLMFHHFPQELGINDCLVRSTEFSYAESPIASFISSIAQSGYVRQPIQNQPNRYLKKSLPPLEFEYSQVPSPEELAQQPIREVDAESLENLPYGLDGTHYQWVDLDGEGLSGILTEQAGSWFYKPNLSPVNLHSENGAQSTLAQFGPVKLVARQPSLAALQSGRQQLLDLAGDGQLDLVEFDGPTPGFFERTEEENWEPFTPFASLPVLDWRNPNLKFVDLTGDGHADLLISEDDAFWWHTSLAAAGFGPAQRVPQALDEEKGPKLIFADGTDSIFLADVSGDGLTDLVRIRNGEVCYWPNLGYGRFGARVTMDQAPWFESPDLFDGRRIRLADIDGSGTTDIVYFASSGVHLYFNQSGNAWGERRVLSQFPPVESVSSATALDLLGNGTACLVWSSPLPGNARRPMRYIDLMGGQKPHLLVQVTNNLGAETRVQYAPSTRFYVADKLAGTPWLTRIPFPVHVVERVETYDYVSRNRFVTRYAYHHGFYDGVEREFRGFGRVDQWDTEEFAALTGSGAFPQATNVDAASHVPPLWTRTWFHTGAYFGEARVSKHLEQEYYREGDPSDAIAALTVAQLEVMLLDDTVLPTNIMLPDGSRLPYNLSTEEVREACRALRGSILRQEIYALDKNLDGTPTEESDRPYSVSERNYTIEVLQPQGPNKYAVFFTHARETIDFHYERKLFQVADNTLADPNALPHHTKEVADPRVTHAITLAVDPFGNVLQSVAVGYGRRYPDTSLTPADQTRQGTTLSTYTENNYTNAVLQDDAYRAPLPAEASTFELTGYAPTGPAGRFQASDFVKPDPNDAKRLIHVFDSEIQYEQQPTSGKQRRLIQQVRTLYRKDDLTAFLDLTELESQAIPGESYKLAFTPGLLAQVFQRNNQALLPDPADVLGSVGVDGGGYVDLDGDGHWWIPSGRMFYLPAAAAPQQEKNQALQHFFLPRRFEDPFGNSTSVNYDDPHDLLVVRTVDAVANTVAAANDYRVLQPTLLTDPNGNRAAVSFDVLGMVVGTAVRGKTTEKLGDCLTSFEDCSASFTVDLTEQQINDFYSADDPHALAGTLLGTATARILYDVNRFWRTRTTMPNDPSKWEPAFAATVARETHVSDLPLNQSGQLQISFSYSDGFGREIQKKIQAEPGPIIDGGQIVNPRWVGSGWTIFNNKGKPVRQYEPFFSQLPAKGHQFEFGVQIGVSPILCYDPVERVVATIHPNHTYEKVVFDPWRQDTWDVNDTVLQADPQTDADTGDFFQRLPTTDYVPTWYTQRTSGGLGAQEQDAATRTAAHANTPTIAYFDTLGRTFLTIADNAADGKYPTRIELDIEGNQRSVTDALGRKVMVYDYDMLSNRIHQASMEAGERWMLNDVAGKSIRAWDSRGHNFRTTYDALRRPTGIFVQGSDPNNSDPRALNGEVQYEKTDYGEGQPNDQALNLRTRVFKQYDAAGVVTSMGRNVVTNRDESYDFKGNLLRSSRQFVEDYKALPDWSGVLPTLQPKAFTSSTQFDALNRPVAATTPDGSVFRPTYNEANFLERVDINLRGAQAATPFVTNIDYNARGQRVLIEYGNNAATSYTYDPATFRLVHLTTTRQGFSPNERVVQDLSYTYDPVGNITHIQDDADIQNVVFFRNRRVEPSNDYTYDAIYRLIQASGREHLGQTGAGQTLPSAPTSYNDFPRFGLLPATGDGKAMGTYSEQYQYDAVGNFLQFIHRGTDPANPGWARAYTYNEASLIEPGQTSNRLTRTMVNPGGMQPQNENYMHDLHGNITRMPQLQVMGWDFKDQLQLTQRQAVNTDDSDGVQHQGERTYYVYDATGQRVRKVTERQNGTRMKERLHLGSFEVYREYSGNGDTVVLERETLHAMDDKQRIALVETRTQGRDGSAAQLLRYQFSNHLGSACLELDDRAQVISYEEYYPYGSTSYQAVRSQVETLKRYRYTGKERDEESGLYYHGARYYAAWLGRWVSCDPKGMVDGVNLYFYVKDIPVVLVDPNGKAAADVPKQIESFVAAVYKDYSAYVNILEKTTSLNASEIGTKAGEFLQERVVTALKSEFGKLAEKSYSPTLLESGHRIDLLINQVAIELKRSFSSTRSLQKRVFIEKAVEKGHLLAYVTKEGYEIVNLGAKFSRAELNVFASFTKALESTSKKAIARASAKILREEALKLGTKTTEKTLAKEGLEGGEKVGAKLLAKGALEEGGKVGAKLTAKTVGRYALKFVPYVGIAIGIYFVQKDLREHKFGMAVLDAVEAIPVVGDIVGIGHLAVVAGVGEEIQDTAKAFQHAGKFLSDPNRVSALPYSFWYP